MNKINFNADIDIDVDNRDQLLSFMPHIIAKTKNNKPHISGVYFQHIPFNQETNLANYISSKAQEDGWIKFDFLNLTFYSHVDSQEELNKLADERPDWSLLERKDVVEKLNHIHNYYNLVNRYKPKSIDQLAMLIALIRPGKKHLIGLKYNELEKYIWRKSTGSNYHFKKSHAYAYALTIVAQLNLLRKKMKYTTVYELLEKQKIL